jgi:hypothetical protein
MVIRRNRSNRLPMCFTNRLLPPNPDIDTKKHKNSNVQPNCSIINKMKKNKIERIRVKF